MEAGRIATVFECLRFIDLYSKQNVFQTSKIDDYHREDLVAYLHYVNNEKMLLRGLVDVSIWHLCDIEGN